MNKKQATRPIRKGSHWMNSEEEEVIITKANSRSVYYKTTTGGVGFAEIWHFRANYVPGRRKVPQSSPAVIPRNDSPSNNIVVKVDEVRGVMGPDYALITLRNGSVIEACDEGVMVQLRGHSEGKEKPSKAVVARFAELLSESAERAVAEATSKTQPPEAKS